MSGLFLFISSQGGPWNSKYEKAEQVKISSEVGVVLSSDDSQRRNDNELPIPIPI